MLTHVAAVLPGERGPPVRACFAPAAWARGVEYEWMPADDGWALTVPADAVDPAVRMLVAGGRPAAAAALRAADDVHLPGTFHQIRTVERLQCLRGDLDPTDERTCAAVDRDADWTERGDYLETDGHVYMLAEMIEAAREMDPWDAVPLLIHHVATPDMVGPYPIDLWELAHAQDPAHLTPDMRAACAHFARRARPPQGLAHYGYQQVGITFGAATGYRCIVGDAMGLGKTPTAVGMLVGDHAHLTPALVVAPSSAVSNWVDEIQRWAPRLRPVAVTTSRGKLPPPCARRVWVISWGLVARVAHRLLATGVQCVVFDEAQYAKHGRSQRSQGARALAHAAPHVMHLSGTPMEGRVEDLWHLLHMLDPRGFPLREPFAARYGRKTTRELDGTTYRDENRLGRLHDLRMTLRAHMVRRVKSDVLTQLPEKTRVTHWVDLPSDALQAYRNAEKQIHSLIAASLRKRRVRWAIQQVRRGIDVAQAVQQANADARFLSPAELSNLAMVVMGYMRRITGRAKIGSAVAWLEGFLRDGDPIVVFHQHKAVREALVEMLDRLGVPWTGIEGATPTRDRGKAVATFQHGRAQVFLASYGAANTAITLTRASHMLMVERLFVPTAEEQAEDRIHRIGQKNAATVYYLMARNTLDERVHEILTTKRRDIATVMGKERVGESEDDLTVDGRLVKVASALFRREVQSTVQGGVDADITVNDVVQAMENA